MLAILIIVHTSTSLLPSLLLSSSSDLQQQLLLVTAKKSSTEWFWWAAYVPEAGISCRHSAQYGNSILPKICVYEWHTSSKNGHTRANNEWLDRRAQTQPSDNLPKPFRLLLPWTCGTETHSHWGYDVDSSVQARM